MHLFTPVGYSHKADLGVGKGYGTAILYLAPAGEANDALPGVNLCPGHSPECFANCLIHSGQMITPHAHLARVRRTRLLKREPEQFGRLLVKDIASHLKYCDKHGLSPSFRFNGTSDFHWETWPVPHLGVTVHEYLLETRPEAVVNEYTKRFLVMKRYLAREYPPNLYMTFSLHELNAWQARIVLALGGNVTVVFRVERGGRLPAQWWGHPVLDGDTDDLRWLDNRRAAGWGLGDGPFVIGLRFKSSYKGRGDSPFVMDPDAAVIRHALPLAS
jgi:hypothetical protein